MSLFLTFGGAAPADPGLPWAFLDSLIENEHEHEEEADGFIAAPLAEEMVSALAGEQDAEDVLDALDVDHAGALVFEDMVFSLDAQIQEEDLDEADHAAAALIEEDAPAPEPDPLIDSCVDQAEGLEAADDDAGGVDTRMDELVLEPVLGIHWEEESGVLAGVEEEPNLEPAVITVDERSRARLFIANVGTLLNQ